MDPLWIGFAALCYCLYRIDSRIEHANDTLTDLYLGLDAKFGLDAAFKERCELEKKHSDY